MDAFTDGSDAADASRQMGDFTDASDAVEVGEAMEALSVESDEVEVGEVIEEVEAADRPAAFGRRPLHDQLLQPVPDSLLRRRLKRAFQVDSKRSRIVELQLEERDAKIRSQWSRRRLHEGDCLAPRGDMLSAQQLRRANEERRRQRVAEVMTTKTEGTVYANRATEEGLLFNAFSSIGGNKKTCLRTLHREIDLLAIAALASRWDQNEKVKMWKLDVMAEKPPWLHITRGYDLQSLMMQFGKLADIARPVAKYWWYDVASNTTDQKQAASDGAWRQLSFEEYKRRQTIARTCLHDGRGRRQHRKSTAHCSTLSKRALAHDGATFRGILASIWPYLFPGVECCSNLVWLQSRKQCSHNVGDECAVV